MNMSNRPLREVDTRSSLPQVFTLPRTGAAGPRHRAAGPCQVTTTAKRGQVALSPLLHLPSRRSTPSGLSRSSVIMRVPYLGCAKRTLGEFGRRGPSAGPEFENCGDFVPDPWCVEASQT